MSGHYAIQARRIRRRNAAPVRNEVRLARADTLPDARAAAHGFHADGFTVWIYRVQPGERTAPHYQHVETLRPEDNEHEPPRTTP
ncbi:MAG: hypothetical protein LH603_06575 [Pseudonocardia sp.]|nr:hypothetical protein [Pseudonocardia sp.]